MVHVYKRKTYHFVTVYQNVKIDIATKLEVTG